MPTFGFVLTLGASAETTVEALGREPGITLGAFEGSRLPLVLECLPEEHAETRIDRWLRLPGVVHVDYAFAAFEDLVSQEPGKEEPA